MKEIRAIINAYSTIDFATTSAALATVVRVEGSSYRRMGARMLVLDNGQYIGGISGGCLEGDALRKAQKAIINNSPSVVTYDTTKDEEDQIGVGLGCNGVIDILFTPLVAADPQNPVSILASVTGTRVPQALITVTKSNQTEALGKMTLYEDDRSLAETFPFHDITGRVAADVKSCLDAKTSASLVYETAGGSVAIFIEVVMPEIALFLFGGNYDVYPLIRMGKEIGWAVTVVTALSKASKLLFDLADLVKDQKINEEFAFDPYTAVVLMAHDLKTDTAHLKRVLSSKAFYIGLLGPAKRSQKIFEALAQEGTLIREEERSRIFTPAGLDIGANTPEEIALSIIAEIKSCFSGRQGASLRLRDGAIHDS